MSEEKKQTEQNEERKAREAKLKKEREQAEIKRLRDKYFEYYDDVKSNSKGTEDW